MYLETKLVNDTVARAMLSFRDRDRPEEDAGASIESPPDQREPGMGGLHLTEYVACIPHPYGVETEIGETVMKTKGFLLAGSCVALLAAAGNGYINMLCVTPFAGQPTDLMHS
jgi:hypothetical protein